MTYYSIIFDAGEFNSAYKVSSTNLSCLSPYGYSYIRFFENDWHLSLPIAALRELALGGYHYDEVSEGYVINQQYRQPEIWRSPGTWFVMHRDLLESAQLRTGLDVYASVILGDQSDNFLDLSALTQPIFVATGSGADRIHTTTLADVIRSGDGDDRIESFAGNDVIFAGAGNDLVHSGEGDDFIVGGPGNDNINTAGGDDVIALGAGTNTVDGGLGNDRVFYTKHYTSYDIIQTGQTWAITDKQTDLTDTLINIEEISFCGLQLKLNQHAAVGMPDIIYAGNEKTLTIPIKDLLKNDWKFSANTLVISSIHAMGGGSAIIQDDNIIITFAQPGRAMTFTYELEPVSIRDQFSFEPTRYTVPVLVTQAENLQEPLLPLQTSYLLLNLPDVWTDYDGAGTRIGIIENSAYEYFDRQHSELCRAVTATDASIDEHDYVIIPHTTAVASILAAGANQTGMLGVAPAAQLQEFTTLPGGFASADMQDVLNVSWGPLDFTINFAEKTPTMQQYAESLQQLAHTGRAGLGTIVCVAAGNGEVNANLSNLANASEIICVGGTLEKLRHAWYFDSNYFTPGSNVLISAPADDVLAANVELLDPSLQNILANYGHNIGTSFSTPLVSGVCALLIQANPTLGVRDVQTILAHTAIYVPDEQLIWQVNNAHNHNGGGLHFESHFGFGQVDAYAAVRVAESWLQSATFNNEYEINVDFQGQTVIASNQVVYEFTLGRALIVEHAELFLQFDNFNTQHTRLYLRSPSGTISTLYHAQDSESYPECGFTFNSVQFHGEDALGLWQVQIVTDLDNIFPNLIDTELHLRGDRCVDQQVMVLTQELAENIQIMGIDGISTINASAVASDSQIDLRPGNDLRVNSYQLHLASDTQIVNASTGDGNDYLIGNDLANRLFGGRGNDTYLGGGGKDTFVLWRQAQAVDVIEDFVIGEDKVDVTHIATEILGQLFFEQKGSDTVLHFADDQALILQNVLATELTEMDFVGLPFHDLCDSHLLS